MHIDLTSNLNTSAKEVLVRRGEFVLSSQADSIDFSNKLVEMLRDKVDSHNESCDSKVSFNQLKKIFVRSAQTYAANNEFGASRSAFALARVNKYLDWVRIKSEKPVSNPLVLDLIDDSELRVEDLNLAGSEIEKYELNVAEFDPRHDLFISDNDFPVKISCRIDI